MRLHLRIDQPFLKASKNVLFYCFRVLTRRCFQNGPFRDLLSTCTIFKISTQKVPFLCRRETHPLLASQYGNCDNSYEQKVQTWGRHFTILSYGRARSKDFCYEPIPEIGGILRPHPRIWIWFLTRVHTKKK